MKVWVFQVEEIDVNVTNINGKDYIEVDTIDVNRVKYVYLSNENDDKDYLILRVVSENGKEFYDKIEYLYMNRSLLEQMKVFAYEKSKEFHADKIWEQLKCFLIEEK